MPFSIFLSPLDSGVNGPMGVLANMDPNWQTYDDYYVKLFIEFEEVYRSGTFTDLDLEIYQRPGVNDEVIFNIARLLKNKVGFNFPDIGGIPSAIKADNMTRRFKVRLEEFKNGSFVSSVSSAIIHAYPSGFSWHLGSYLKTFINQKRFLTHQPMNKVVSSVQPEFLYLVATSTEDYTLKANLTHEDGTTTLAYDPGMTIAAEEKDVLIFPTGFEQLGLSGINPLVTNWEVYIENDLSEVRSYELDCHCTPLDRYYVLANSLGGYDTVRTSGELIVRDQNEGQRIERNLGPFYPNISSRKLYDVETSVQEFCTQHTGHLSKEENAWLKTLLLSEDAWRIGDYHPNLNASGILIPIIIDRGSFDRYKDQDFLYGFPFSYREAFRSKGLSV